MLDDEGSSLEVGLDRGWRGDRFLAVAWGDRRKETQETQVVLLLLHRTRQHAYSL